MVKAHLGLKKGLSKVLKRLRGFGTLATDAEGLRGGHLREHFITAVAFNLHFHGLRASPHAESNKFYFRQ